MRVKLFAPLFILCGLFIVSPVFALDYCLNFDGVNDYVTTNDSGTLNISGTAITLEAWLYPTDFKTNPWDNTIIGKTNSSNLNKGFELRYGGSNGTLSFNFGNGSAWCELTAPNALTLNTWQHVAATYDGAFMRLYVNAIQVASTPQTSAIVHSPANLRLSWGFSGRFMKGRLDNIRIWNVCRSQADIDWNKARPLESQTGLVLNYPITNGTGSLVVDTSNNSNHGTMYDGTSWLSPGGPYLPTVTTWYPASGITPTSAYVLGTVPDLGLPNPTQHGHCWSTNNNPTLADSKTELGPKDNTQNGFGASLSNLSPQTNYYYRAYATNLAGTTLGDVCMLKTVPLAPAAQSATNITTTSFVANWDPIPQGYQYFLDVSTSSSFTSYVTGYENFTVFGLTTQEVWNLSPGVRYYYRVRGNVVLGDPSPNSATISVITIPNPPVATAAIFVYDTSFRARWNLSTGASGYYFDLSTDPLFAGFVEGYNNLSMGISSTYLSITNINPGTYYYYRVRAYNSSGISTNSATISLLTYPAAPVSLPPSNITATGFQANWEASSSAYTYRLDVSTDNFATFLSGYNNLDVGNITSKVVSGLSSSTYCYFRVRAVNTSATSSNSASQFLRTAPLAPVVSAATNVTVTGFTANWGSTVASGYALDVSTNSSFSSCVSGYENLVLGSLLTCNVTGLAGGTSYYYRVRAYNAYSSSANSATISVITIPPAPSALSSSDATSTSFRLSWASISEVTAYYLDVSAASNFASCLSGYNALNVGIVLNTTVSGLTFGTVYYCRLKAVNTSGVSEYSAVLPVSTQMVSSVNVLITNVNGAMHLSWNSLPGVPCYYIYRSEVPSPANWGIPVHKTASNSWLDADSLGYTHYFYRITSSTELLE